MSYYKEDIHLKEAVDSRTSSRSHEATQFSNLDGAWKFLDDHRDASGEADIRAIRRKIDWHIVPLMFLCYTMQFLDKVILNVSTPFCYDLAIHNTMSIIKRIMS
jgi:hypothetical protein